MREIAVWWRGKCALRFLADEAEVGREDEALILTAQGQVTFQDAEAVARLLLGQAPCRWELTEKDASLMDDTFTTTLFALEPDRIVAHLRVPEHA